MKSVSQPILWILLIASEGFFATGCSTIDSHECGKTDWAMVGEADARYGRSQAFLEEHRKSCDGSGVTIDNEAYERGFAKGRLDYCTPDGGYNAGVNGEAQVGTCDGEKQTQFIDGYTRGRKVFLLQSAKRENEKLLEKARDEEKEKDDDYSVIADIGRVLTLLGASSGTKTSRLENEQASLNQDLALAQAEAPLTSRTELLQRPSSSPNATMGALAGTVFGFGIGHAVQGRYATTGWKWTIAEAATLGTLIAVQQANCHSATRVTSAAPEGESVSECSNALPVLAMLGWITMRVWQSYDLWNYSYQSSLGYTSTPKSGFGVTLQENRPMLNWAMTW